MSYQVLARKWRPATFKDLIGQESVSRILINSLTDQRLHPALIFAGPRGTGKTSTARILAKTLCCPNTKETQPCCRCATCKDIDGSRSLDVMEIDGASNNGVEAVRQLKETISCLPSGAYKIYIIDEVHMLSTSAFNALLKTLEEPPPHAIFIMATTEMRKLPATVLSRCQILQFNQIPDHLIFKQLEKICQEEQVQTEESALWIIVRESQGSLRDAQGLLDQMITFCKKEFKEKDVNEILGITDRRIILKSLQSLLDRNSSEVLEVLDQLHAKGAEPELFLKNLIIELRNMLLLKISSGSVLRHLISLSEKEQAELLNKSQSVTEEELHLLFDMALKGSWDLARAQDPKIFLEMLLLRMSQAPYIESFFTQQFNSPHPIDSPVSQPIIKNNSSPSSTQKKTKDDVRNHHFIKEVQNIFKADLLSPSEGLSEHNKPAKIDKNKK